MKISKSYRIFQVINSLILAGVVVATLFPFLHLFAVSFSSRGAVMTGSVGIWPVEFNLAAYKEIGRRSSFWTGYANTVKYTFSGGVLSMVMTILCAYPLSRKHLMGHNVLMKIIVFTMFFTGGLIPVYLLVSRLSMVDTIWAMIVPNAITAYNVIIMRTFFANMPSALEDAAKIDGLNDMGILVRIILPLSKPIIATISLFVVVNLWNDWFSALLFLNDNDMHPITMFLREIIYIAIADVHNGNQFDMTDMQTVPQNLQAATVMLITVPILCVYPFIQKYFVKGVMIGSIKG